MAGPDAIEIPITTDTTKFAQQTAKATKGLYDLEKAQIAVEAAGQALTFVYERIVKVQVDAVREMDRLSKSSQINAKTIAGLRLAALATGQAMENLVPVDFADKLQELRDGNKTFVEDFKLLGLTARDFEEVNYDVSASFEIVTRAMASTTDKTRAAAGASRLFSTAGENMFAVFGDGAKTLDDYVATAAKVGLGTDEARANAEEMSVAIGKLTVAFDELTAQAGALVADSGALGLVEDFARGAVFAFEKVDKVIRMLADAPMLKLYAGIYGLTQEALRPLVNETRTVQEEMARLDASLKFTFSDTMNDNVFDVGAFRDAMRSATVAAKDLRSGVAGPDGSTPMGLFGPAFAATLAADVAAAQGAAVLIDQIRADEMAAEVDALRAWSDARAKATADELAAIERTKDARQSAAIASIDYAENALGSIVALADGTNSEIRGVLTAVAIAERAASVARALFQVGPAYAQGLAAAPPPLSFALGALNAGAVVAAAAAAAVAPLPRFHTGGTAPDETVAVLKKDETVLTPEGANAYNAGRGGGAPTEAIVVIGHQAIDRASVRALQDPGSGLAKAITRGDLPGRTRRRRP